MPRKHISQKTRDLVFEKDAGKCYLCGLPASRDNFDLEHEIALELGGLDELSNYRVAHKDCHKIKSKDDIRLIAKGRRIRRANGPVELRRKTKAIPQSKNPWPKRKFARRQKNEDR